MSGPNVVSSVSSGLKTADAAIKDSSGALWGVCLIAATTNDCAVAIYDNASAASGTLLAEMAIDASIEGNGTTRFFSLPGVSASNGIYADVTGTSASYIVYYE